MGVRCSRMAMGLLVIALVALMPGRSWAVFFPLGPAKDEWGLKYSVEVKTDGEKLNVIFTLADEGRLKPIYSATVIAFSNPRSDGGRTYLVKAPIELRSTGEGKLAGQAQISKQFLDRAMIRILTTTFDGRPQTAGARYYDIPLKKFVNVPPVAASTPAPQAIASPPTSKVTK